jgi:hypothetical protein
MKRRRRKNPSWLPNNWPMWALIAVGVYLIYKTFTGAKTVLVNAQQAAGSTLADAIQFVVGTGQAQPGEVYTVTMPDGSVQTVAYGQLPIAAGITNASQLPAAGTGMQIGTGNSILDSISAGAAAGG